VDRELLKEKLCQTMSGLPASPPRKKKEIKKDKEEEEYDEIDECMLL